MRTVIIDDEQNALDVIKLQLEKFCSDVEIVAVCLGGNEGISAITKYQPELVFLDIEMPHVNGFDVLEQTKGFNYKVIFTTAYNQFAIKAFKFSALDYLMKPIDIEELQKAVTKTKAILETEVVAKKISTLLNYIQPEESSKRIALSDGGMLVFYEENEICRIEGDSNYSHVYLTNGKKITLSKTLKDIEERLGNVSFYRVHQSHIINTKLIKKIAKGENSFVVLNDDTIVPISRSKKDSFLEHFTRL